MTERSQIPHTSSFSREQDGELITSRRLFCQKLTLTWWFGIMVTSEVYLSTMGGKPISSTAWKSPLRPLNVRDFVHQGTNCWYWSTLATTLYRCSGVYLCRSERRHPQGRFGLVSATFRRRPPRQRRLKIC